MPLASQPKLSFEDLAMWLEQEDFEAEDLIELLAELANGEYDQHEFYEDVSEALGF
ncbi:MAG: hypothetical protein KC422_01280 [Trueperaceae bacterium]|nr:hypothetical protein [Trueperaceae bacterium]